MVIHLAREGNAGGLVKSGLVDSPIPFDDWRPLQLAAAEGDDLAVQTLLDAGAQPNLLAVARVKVASAALMIAARYGHKTTCTLLIERGADPNLEDSLGFRAVPKSSLNFYTPRLNFVFSDSRVVRLKLIILVETKKF